MQGNMTYLKARKLNAVFLLLLFATDHSSDGQQNREVDPKNNAKESERSPDYFDQKLKEFESEKYRF